ncbi:MAG: Unknown protein [uncultured Sulfurovum sp.]|uniref:Uncharacterized protein n=1 Tax=uncultured Sulfurovum sp. TaxID=269237 RepID=A0A6S6TQ82_9BACT|nr:MAG: Unknown protein [uncultured Sulfurovum sp.]
MKELWSSIKFLFLFILIVFGLDYGLDKTALPITVGDVFFILLGMVMYIGFFIFLKEYFFEKTTIRNRIFMEVDKPFWKLLGLFIFFIMMLIVGCSISYIGLIAPLELVELKGNNQHGYSVALFGTGFTLWTLIACLACLRSLLLKC